MDVSLHRALAMYGLHSVKIHCETSTDTRCLVAWSQSMIVIAFRGTASLANVKADLQASRRSYPGLVSLRGSNLHSMRRIKCHFF